MLDARRTSRLLFAILFGYLALATGYNMTTPIFEAPDENHHFFAARHIVQYGTLPSAGTAGDLARQEAAQPPLYYVLAAPLIAAADTSDMEALLWPNPSAVIGRAQPVNVNVYVHTEQEAWPWHGYALAAHLVRALSTLIGLGTLLSIFFAGRLLWPARPAVSLLATALVAFLPQYGFLHGAITNDVLIIFLASFALWQLLRLWLTGITPRRLLLLGSTTGLAILAKVAGVLLLPLSLLVLGMLALQAWRAAQTAGDQKVDLWPFLARLAGQFALVIFPALLISGWWFWRNWALYGDPTATSQFVALAGGNRRWTLRQVWGDLDRVAMSAVAYFGWMNVRAPSWLYGLWLAILAVAGGGWLAAAWRRLTGAAQAPPEPDQDWRKRGAALWLGIWVLLIGVAWLRFMMQTPADQGRLLFPALLPLALAVARGVTRWRRPWLAPAAAAAALATSLYSLVLLLPGVYNPAAHVAAGAVPPEAAWPALEMSPGIELLGARQRTEVLRPGEWAWVDLYWRATAEIARAPQIGAALYGRQNALVGSQEQYHGGGTYPANLWPLGQIVRDRVAVQLNSGHVLPAELRLLMRVDDRYQPVEIARIKAVPEQWPQVQGEPLATLGPGIDLLEATVMPREAKPGTTLHVSLLWRVAEAPGQELTTFVHLGNPAQAPLAQGDGPAVGGDYPVALWEAGEVIDDHYALQLPADLPPGQYPIHIGFYDPQNGARLPVLVAGKAQPFDAFSLGSLPVAAE